MNNIRLLLISCLTMTASALTAMPLSVDSLSADTAKTSKKASPKKEKAKSDYEKLLAKGGSEQKGLFTVRHIDGKWYFEVPDSILGRLLLCVTRYNAVPQGMGPFAGEEVGHSALYLEQHDAKTLHLRQWVRSQEADSDEQVTQTLLKSTIDPIAMSFSVVGRNKKTKAQLIDVTPLFKKDNNLTGLPSTTKTTLKVGSLSDDRTYIDTMMVFPTNIEIRTTRTYNTSGVKTQASHSGSLTLGLNTSIVLLPKEPMRKRLWDKRVGFFTTPYTRFSDQQLQTDHEAFVSRFRLEPKDEKRYLSGELTEPRQPIVFYIDPATPEKWVPYLMQGIEDWNVAFEAAGFKNAIRAERLPKQGVSLGDARYSAMLYLPSETENAYGPRIVDPRSGEIIEAHVCWFHNVTNLLRKWYMVQCGPNDPRAQTMDMPDELMGQLVRFVSSHEVGHSLGLRHNMGASSATPVEKLRQKQWVEQNGHTVSIMDYARFNYVAQPEDHIAPEGLFPRIGPYDRWAIEWGYRWRPEFADEQEEKVALMSETTARLKADSRLWFAGEGRDGDPRSQTEDLGDNSIKAAQYGLKNLRRVVAGLPKWTAQDNDQTDHLQMMFRAATDQFMRYANHVATYIGGRYRNNLPGKALLENVPATLQREALSYLSAEVFTAPAWLYPEEICQKLGIDASQHNNNRQTQLLTRLMSQQLFTSLCANAAVTPAGDTSAYPLPDYLSDLFNAAFAQPSQQSDWQANARRMLQRAYINNVRVVLAPTEAEQKSAVGQAVGNTDAVLYLTSHLTRLKQYCEQHSQTGSELSRQHYSDLLRRIEQIEEKMSGK